MTGIRTLTVSALGLALVCAHAQAQNEDEELAALMAVLDEETEIVTHTRLNADFVPGVLTVLRGEEMFALGARTVHDALTLVPGMQIYRDDLGNASLRPRGLNFTENSGQVKLMVNGLDYFRESSGLNNAILTVPIEQVERIEVIRGPGSGVHGDFAFAGLVNIVTRTGDSRVHGIVGSDGLISGGAQLNVVDEDADFVFDLGISAWHADELDSAREAPGTSEQRYLAQLVSRWHGFGFKLAAIDRDAMQPGAMNLRPAEEDGYTLELSHRWDDEAAKRSIFVALRHGDSELNNGGNQFYDGGGTEFGVEVTQDFGKHRLLAGAKVGNRSSDGITNPPPSPPPMPGAPPPPPPMMPTVIDLDQDTYALLIQDEIDLEPVTLTLGARYDKLQDFDSRISPRAAAVWRIDDRHTLKGQYAEGFRSASGFEQTRAQLGGYDLGYETIKLTEAQYLYRLPTSRFKIAAYVGKVSDLIDPVRPMGPTPGGFQNAGEIDLSGVEAEWSWNITPRLMFVSNLSLLDTEVNAPSNPNMGENSFAQPDYLANLAMTWSPTDDWTLGAHLNLVGDRYVPDDEDFDGYQQLNLSAIWRSPQVKGLTVRGSVRNALGDDVTYLQLRAPNRVLGLNFEQRMYQLEVVWDWN